MPIKYPRTCDACGGTYANDGNFSRHRTKGCCARKQHEKQQTVASDSVHTANDTTINTVVNVKVNETANLPNDETHPFSSSDCLHIYVVETRHAMEMKLSVYKVGVTKSIIDRSQQYPKQSRVLFSQVYPNARSRETLLHRAMRSQPQFKIRTDWGREYYEGNVHEIIEFVSTFMKNQ